MARTLRSALTPSAPTKRPASVIEEVALPPDPNLEELLGELELPLDDVAAPGQDDEAVTRVDGAAQTTSAKEDLFGIVG